MHLVTSVCALVAGVVLGLGVRRPPPRRPACVLLAVLGAVGAATGGAQPTGTPVADMLLVGAAGAAAPFVGSRSSLAACVVAAGIVAAAADPGWPSIVSFAAIGLALSGVGGRSLSVHTAASATGTVAAASHLGWPSTTGATTLLAIVAVGLLCLPAAASVPARHRRRGAAAAGVVVTVWAVAAGLYAFTAAAARADLERAAEAAEAGLAAATSGDRDASLRLLDEAAASLASGSSRLDRPWAMPARVVPLAGLQVRAVAALVDVADEIVVAGRTVLERADVQRIRARDGRVDIDELEAMLPPLRHVDVLLASVPDRVAEVQSPWLLAPIADRLDEIEERALDAQVEARAGRDAVESLPSLLGGRGDRRWLLAVMTPSTSLGGGGFIGNWGIVTARDGKLALDRFVRAEDLAEAAPYDLAVSAEFDARYLQRFKLDRFPANAAASPHFPSVAEAVRQIAARGDLGAVDGVIGIDPIGLAALLQLTGPVEVEGVGDAITTGTAARLLLHDQYQSEDRSARADFLEATTRAVFERLTTGELPAANVLVEALRPAVRGRHLQVVSLRDADRGFLRRIGIDGAMRPLVGDGLGVVMHDASETKLDYFMRRTVVYDVSVDASGAATANVTVDLLNTAPPGISGAYFSSPTLPESPPGTNRTMLSLYTALELDSLLVDGARLEPDRSQEQGRRVFDRFVTTGPGEQVRLEYRLRGRLDRAGDGYRLDVHRQPTVAPDRLTVRVNGEVLFDGEHDQDLVLTTAL